MSVDIITKIINEIKNKRNHNIVIVMHNNPDGDSIGSAIALEKTLLKLGKNVDVVFQNKISKIYKKIVGESRINRIILPRYGKKYDLLFLLDCSSIDRTINNVDKISKKIITIDHHANCKPFGNIYLYEKAASTGIIIYKIINRLMVIDEEIATALYLTIRSDTSNFKNNNTDSKAHEIASKLVFKGADISLINEIYENKTLSFLRLMGNVLSDVKYDDQCKLVYLIVNKDHLILSNSNYEEASMLIEYIKNIENANIACLFLVNSNNVRIKMRSKKINVLSIIKEFDGGGHANASGAIIYDDDIYSVVNKVIKTIRKNIL